MRVFSRSHRILTFMSLLTIGVGFIFVIGASAEPPLGILGDVTVTNTPLDVNVTNDANSPVPIVVQNDNINEPIHATHTFNLNNTGGSLTKLLDVPSNKRLVITYASLAVESQFGNPFNYPQGSIASLALSTELTTGGSTPRVKHSIGMTPTSLINQGNFSEVTVGAIGKEVHLIADPGSTVDVIVARNYIAADEDVTATIVGYLEPLP